MDAVTDIPISLKDPINFLHATGNTYILHATYEQGGITCGAIDEPRKSSKAIDERVIIYFRDKNIVIARFRHFLLSIAFLFYR